MLELIRDFFSVVHVPEAHQGWLAAVLVLVGAGMVVACAALYAGLFIFF